MSEIKLNYHKTHFLTSAPNIRSIPEDTGIEIAFAGRSNAGKSTALLEQIYRTQSGTEVDFVLDGPMRKLAVECKFKRLQNPVSIPSLVNFADDEKIKLRYIANINLDTEYKGVHLTPGILVDRIGK